jgi:DNA modification methylase
VTTQILGLDLFGNSVLPPERGVLASKFLFSPFSVMDARSGFWQDRKRAWIGLGIKSEIGRGERLTYQSSVDVYARKRAAEAKLGRLLTQEEFERVYYDDESLEVDEDADGGVSWSGLPTTSRGNRALGGGSGGTASTGLNTSIFDPVLAELVYRWFSPSGGLVLDPFAGGSVRGIVASLTGRPYYGIDLSEKQIAANRINANEILTADDPPPRWIVGDSLDLLAEAPEADLVFSCPPYGDLERYSDDPRDLSTMEYHTFVAAYRRILLRAVDRLRPNRFAAFVVGDFRDSKGFLRSFVAATAASFESVGAKFYNDAILVTAVGSGSLRANRQFSASRKLVKTHQNLLVFVKGDPVAAAKACGVVEVATAE